MSAAPTDAPPTRGSSNPAPPPAPTQQQRQPMAIRHGRGPIIDDESGDDTPAHGDDDDDGREGADETDGLLSGHQPQTDSSSRDIENQSLSKPSSTRGIRSTSMRKQSSSTRSSTAGAGSRSRNHLRTLLYLLLGFVLVTLMVVFVFGQEFIRRWIEGTVENEGGVGEIVRKGLVVEGPFVFDLLEQDRVAGEGEGGTVVVRVGGWVGMDVAKSMGDGLEGGKEEKRRERKWMKWATRNIGGVEINTRRVALTSGDEFDRGRELIVLERGVRDLVIPLSYPSQEDDEPKIRLAYSLLDLTFNFPDPSYLGEWAKRVWERKSFESLIQIGEVSIKQEKRLGTGVWGNLVARYLGKGGVGIGNLKLDVGGVLPPLPSDPSTLVTLDQYTIYQRQPSPSDPSSSSILSLLALANLSNPFPLPSLPPLLNQLAWSMPFDIPVEIFLPVSPSSSSTNSSEADEKIRVATVQTRPFKFDRGQESTQIQIEGEIIGPSSSDDGVQDGGDKLKDTLAKLVGRYLKGMDSTILVKYDRNPIINEGEEERKFPPPFVGDVAGDVEVPLIFPGAKEKLEFFKNLRIEDMKIRMGGGLTSSFDLLHWGASDSNSANLDLEPEPEGDLLCSGRVVADLVFPTEFASLADSISVTAVLPDVYIYDGGLPPSSSYLSSSPSSQLSLSLSSSYPPVPIPATAFARLRPTSSIPAFTTHPTTNQTILTASFIDAPLFILPGREDVFRKFVGKIILGGAGGKKVRVGVRGVSEVGLELMGVGWGEIGLTDVEVQGEFDVGGLGGN